jgi:hypothetical protein
MHWSSPFHDPIQPPKGKPLLTLKDAADYIRGITVASKTWLKSKNPLSEAVQREGKEDWK